MIPLVFHPIYSQLDLPVRHRFPTEKYQGIRNALAVQGVADDSFYMPSAVSTKDLCQVFNPQYVQQLVAGTLDVKAMRRIGFPWSAQLIQRSLTAVGGTILTAELALEHGKALNLTGGYHHAFANYGSGFCLFNDLYLAALTMLNSPKIDKVLIFDCDVHQGDGTAKLAENNSQIYTVSLHAEKNFPYRKQHSNMDFNLLKGTQDTEYLDTVDSALYLAINTYQPDAVIYDAGADIHINDDLGHLSISTEGVYQRDCMVFDICKRKGFPVAAVIGGGYQRNIKALVQVHLQLYKAAGVI